MSTWVHPKEIEKGVHSGQFRDSLHILLVQWRVRSHVVLYGYRKDIGASGSWSQSKLNPRNDETYLKYLASRLHAIGVSFHAFFHISSHSESLYYIILPLHEL